MADSNLKGGTANAEIWPCLPLEEWKDTYATLHMWTQIVGFRNARSLLARGEQLWILAGRRRYRTGILRLRLHPEPQGFKDYPVRPGTAFYSSDMREFILPYDAVRQADNPNESLLEFLQSTYEAAANLANWNRSELERMPKQQK